MIYVFVLLKCENTCFICRLRFVVFRESRYVMYLYIVATALSFDGDEYFLHPFDDSHGEWFEFPFG